MDQNKIKEILETLITKTKNKKLTWTKVEKDNIRSYSLTLPEQGEIKLSKVLRTLATSYVHIYFTNANNDIVHSVSALVGKQGGKVVELYEEIETHYYKKEETINSILHTLKNI